MEDIWEQDNDGVPLFEEYEKQQKKDTMTIDSFFSKGAPVGGGSTNRKSSSSGIIVNTEKRRVPFEKQYNTVYSQYINDKFHYDDDDEECDGNHEDESDEEKSLESNKRKRLDDGEEGEGGEGGGRKKRQKRELFDKSKRKECFLCSWGNKQHDGIEAPHVNKLVDIVKTNYAVHDNVDLAWEMHLYFKEDIYDPTTGMEMLTPEAALDHIEGMHSLDAIMYIGEMTRKLKKLYFMLEQSVCFEDGTLDIKVLDQMWKCLKAMNELYKMKPKEMNFSNGNNADDMKRAANCINLLPKFEQKDTRKKTNKQRIII